ncbi:ETX/MTX2 family pore-forming toxin [Bacillus sp. FDAARGOS_1420]|uniref:ETX/MTX2 family pore-forming toxin n=1 Tax=unclassified Bacillus (in: firmicutes) TaxID=185979 RepID=UPI001C5A7F24|nr:ETX/MTX2 family pore-forming toxin [Bacillus sp. FDAARGOS_1420]MBW3496537.1 ETX/MTX2 family pore-forming toxin [Bacillus sp. FDAARGOS_1420]
MKKWIVLTSLVTLLGVSAPTNYHVFADGNSAHSINKVTTGEKNLGPVFLQKAFTKGKTTTILKGTESKTYEHPEFVTVAGLDNTIGTIEQEVQTPSRSKKTATSFTTTNSIEFNVENTLKVEGSVPGLGKVANDLKVGMKQTTGNTYVSSNEITLTIPSQKIRVPAGKHYQATAVYKEERITGTVTNDIELTGNLEWLSFFGDNKEEFNLISELPTKEHTNITPYQFVKLIQAEKKNGHKWIHLLTKAKPGMPNTWTLNIDDFLRNLDIDDTDQKIVLKGVETNFTATSGISFHMKINDLTSQNTVFQSSIKYF